MGKDLLDYHKDFDEFLDYDFKNDDRSVTEFRRRFLDFANEYEVESRAVLRMLIGTVSDKIMCNCNSLNTSISSSRMTTPVSEDSMYGEFLKFYRDSKDRYNRIAEAITSVAKPEYKFRAEIGRMKMDMIMYEKKIQEFASIPAEK